ncbi:MAG: MBL fold metallo-hydrolase [Thermonemataceae bacterium]
MKLQLIRNATVKLNYAGKNILIDPMLCEKDTFPPFVKGLLPNPTVDLTMPIEEVLKGVDSVLVTHSHPDHFDDVSQKILPENIPLFCSIEDKEFEKFTRFTNVQAIEESIEWEEISITRVAAQHGSGPVLPYMGKVSGFVIESQQSPTVYIVSDCIWYKEVENTIKKFNPAVIIANSGGGIIPGFEKYPVMLDEVQTISLAKFAKTSKIVAVHLESIDFCKVTRRSLREEANKNNILSNRLVIPEDGETILL